MQSDKLLVLVMVMFLTSLQLAQCQGKFLLHNTILSLINSLIIDSNYSIIRYTWKERFQDFRFFFFFFFNWALEFPEFLCYDCMTHGGACLHL